MAVITTDLTLDQALNKIAARYPRRKAVSFNGETLTFSELRRRVDRLASGLQTLGVCSGDRVALLLPSCLEFPVAFFAPSALGAVVVPLNPIYRQKEIQHILADSEAAVVIADPRPLGNDVQGILAALRPSLPSLRHVILRGPAAPGMLSLTELPDPRGPLPPPVSPASLCALVYTSGTTGQPKAVMHSHSSMISAVAQSEKSLNEPLHLQIWHLLMLVRQYGRRFLRPGLGQLNLLSVAPLHSLIGYGFCLYGLLYGHHLVIADRFQPARVLELIEQQQVNAMILTPSMLAALLDSPELGRRRVSSLLAVFVAAAPTPPDLVRRARTAFGCPVLVGFGATEVGGLTLMPDFFDPVRLQSETVGKPFPGMEARIVDEHHDQLPTGETGELALRLASNMLGYYMAPELTTANLGADGWYFTGDLATMDGAGYIRIVGRKKDMIIRGGQNIFPAEIEAFLLARPGIENAAVIGVPDSVAGERVWAFILPRAGSTQTPADITNYCRAELAPYKVPDQVRIVETLPLTTTGKVQKYVLQEKALQEVNGTSA
ncbi:MAG: class I adenylate-forming enzyme family protein [Rudaea sp.]